MKKKISIKNGDVTNKGTFTIDDKIYTFPFTSSCYRREKVYIRGDRSHRSTGAIELNLCFGSYDVKKALQKLGIESNYRSRTSYEHCIQQYRKNIGKLVRKGIPPTKDEIDIYCFNEVRKQIPKGLADLIEQTDFEFVVEPMVKLGDETFNHAYEIYGHNLVIASSDLFDTEVKIE